MMPTTSPADTPWLRLGAMGSAALGAMVLLAIFYTVVSGAVERAASRRADAGDHVSAATALSRSSSGHAVELARFGN